MAARRRDKVRNGQTPQEAARNALLGPDSAEHALLPVLVDRWQMSRRLLTVHTFVSAAPLSRAAAQALRPADGRSHPAIVSRNRAWELLPAKARARAQFAVAAQEFQQTAYLEWRAWPRSHASLGLPTDSRPAEPAQPHRGRAPACGPDTGTAAPCSAAAARAVPTGHPDPIHGEVPMEGTKVYGGPHGAESRRNR